jgi:hypothetical protein
VARVTIGRRLAAAVAVAVSAALLSAAPAAAYPRWGDPPYPDPQYFCPNQSPMSHGYVTTNQPTLPGSLDPEWNTFWGWHQNPGYDDWWGRWYGDFRGAVDDDSGWHYMFRVAYGQRGSWHFSDYGWAVHGHVTQWIAYYNPTFGGQCGYGAYGNASAPPYMADVIGQPVVDIYVDAVPPYQAQPRISAASPSSVSFTWDPVADQGDGGGQGYFAIGMGSYDSWVTLDGGAQQQRATTSTPRTLTISGMGPGDTACAYVIAADKLGNAAAPGQVCGQAIAPPPMPGWTFPAGAVDANPSAAGLTGFPSWFWLSPQPQAQTVAETANGYQYQVTATPASTAWAFGDGGAATFSDPDGFGQAYPAPSPVAWTYEAQSQSYLVSATQTYAVSWTAQSGGTTYGPYPMGTVDGPAATLAYPVEQAQPELTG